MGLIANPPTPCRMCKRPPAPENRPAMVEPREKRYNTPKQQRATTAEQRQINRNNAPKTQNRGYFFIRAGLEFRTKEEKGGEEEGVGGGEKERGEEGG